jgi:hypothetical protein
MTGSGGGASVSSYTSAVVGTPVTTPSAPIVSATGGIGQAQLSWTTPAGNGSDVYDFVVQFRLVGAASWSTWAEGVSTATTVTTVTTNQNDLDLTGCVVFEAKIEIDPNPTQVLNDCGCEVDTPDNILSLCLKNNANYVPPSCDSENVASIGQTTSSGVLLVSYYVYQPDGSLYYSTAGTPDTSKTDYVSKECCTAYGGTSFLNNEYENGYLVNSGYFCCYAGGQCGCKLTCNWLAQTTPINISGNNYIQFTAPTNQNRVVTADGCNCLADYSIAVPNITDPSLPVVVETEPTIVLLLPVVVLPELEPIIVL